MDCICGQIHTSKKLMGKSPLIFNSDPSRTLTLRRSFESALYKRFRWLKGLINTSIITNDAFGLKIDTDLSVPGRSAESFRMNQAGPIPKEKFAFERDPKKVSLFMDWLREQIDLGILEIVPGEQLGQAVEIAWTNQYIQTAYQKGMLRARQELNNKGYEVPTYDDAPGGLIGAFNRPFHADKVGIIYSTTFEGLEGITNEMVKQSSGILARGIAEGKNPREIAKQINDRVDKIGITRARTLARTSIIQAHHAATIQEYRNWGVAGVSVLAEWVTAEDSRVCEKCKQMARKNNGYGRGIFTLDQIEGLIPLHPNCRCVAIPVDVTDELVLEDKKPKKEKPLFKGAVIKERTGDLGNVVSISAGKSDKKVKLSEICTIKLKRMLQKVLLLNMF